MLGQREDAFRRHPYRASSPCRAGHVTVARSMTNPIDGNRYENECVRPVVCLLISICRSALCCTYQSDGHVKMLQIIIMIRVRIRVRVVVYPVLHHDEPILCTTWCSEYQ